MPHEGSVIKTLVEVPHPGNPGHYYPAGSYGVIVDVPPNLNIYAVEIIVKDDRWVGGAVYEVVDLTPQQFVEIPRLPDLPFPESG